VIPHIMPELPVAQRAALAQNVKTPIVYTNVLTRNWQPWARLGVHDIMAPNKQKKGRGSRRALFQIRRMVGTDQKSIPPMPPPPGIAGAGDCFFGASATIASVVTSRPATEAASCKAARTTLAGSTMPLSTMST